MGKKKVVLDTNVLISALGWNGKSKEIFRRILRNELELIISYSQLKELQKVMNYPKFDFTEKQKDKFLTIIYEIARVVETTTDLELIKEDPDDNLILASAIENNADYIISGDAHLLNIKKYGNIKVVTPKEFLDII